MSSSLTRSCPTRQAGAGGPEETRANLKPDRPLGRLASADSELALETYKMNMRSNFVQGPVTRTVTRGRCQAQCGEP
jgi:hypothetical protein